MNKEKLVRLSFITLVFSLNLDLYINNKYSIISKNYADFFYQFEEAHETHSFLKNSIKKLIPVISSNIFLI